jgi:hypothetical protein
VSDEQILEIPEPPDYEQLWRYAIDAVKILGREVRSLRAEVEALRGEPK